MKVGAFLRFVFVTLAILSPSISLGAGGSKDKGLEEKIPLETRLEEVQGPSQDTEKEAPREEAEGASQDSADEIFQEESEEPGQDSENGSSQEESSQEGDEPESETVIERPPVPQLMKDGRGKPRLHLYDGEETSILSANTSKTVVTRADGNFTRILYDNEYRLQSRLVWKEGDAAPGDGKTSFTPSELASQEDYFYYDNSRNRQRVVLTDFTDVTRRESFYSLEGLLVREELYSYVPDEEAENKDTPEREKESERKNKSQGKNQESQENEVVGEGEAAPADVAADPWEIFPSLTLIQVAEYQYNQDKALAEKTITHHSEDEKFVQKTVYHSPGNLHGGFDYFENGQLLVSRKYEDESRYTETRYFDTMRVESLYSGSRLLAEVVYLDGKELRRTEF